VRSGSAIWSTAYTAAASPGANHSLIMPLMPRCRQGQRQGMGRCLCMPSCEVHSARAVAMHTSEGVRNPATSITGVSSPLGGSSSGLLTPSGRALAPEAAQQERMTLHRRLRVQFALLNPVTEALPPASSDKLSRVDAAATPALRRMSTLLLDARHAILLVLAAGRAVAKHCDAATGRFSVAMITGVTRLHYLWYQAALLLPQYTELKASGTTRPRCVADVWNTLCTDVLAPVVIQLSVISAASHQCCAA
jgi:hypothetical protein